MLRSPRLALERAVEPPRVEKGRPAIAVIQRHQPVEAGARPGADRAAPRCDGLPAPSFLGCARASRACGRTACPLPGGARTKSGQWRCHESDPFGLCRRARALGEPQVISVHPRVLPLRPLPSGTSRNLEGPSSDMSPQGSVTFHRLREYVIGDDLRKVHWPSTARLGKLVVRQYVDTAQPYTVVLVDLRPEVYSPESFEEAMDVAASVVTSMSAGEAPVQLRTTTGERVGGARQAGPHRPRRLPDRPGAEPGRVPSRPNWWRCAGNGAATHWSW